MKRVLVDGGVVMSEEWSLILEGGDGEDEPRMR